MRKHFLLLLSFGILGLFITSSCKKDDSNSEDNTPTTELDKAKKDYQDNYVGTAVSTLSWTGAVSGCNSGDIGNTVRNKVVQRINYFRRLVGLSDNITLNTSQNQKCQEAALYMLANKELTHYPSSTKSCYTAGAADAAGHGNIAYSQGYTIDKANHTVNAITGYIEDPGDNNLKVGHRSWILYPQLSAVGCGSVWSATDKWAADCMMWGDNLNGTAPATLEFVAYPSTNYFPSTLVFPRWSFSIKKANFNNATVSMTDKSGNAVSLTVIGKETALNSSPDSRIIWEPSVNITTDTEFNVTVSGITAAPKTSYTYKVKVFYVGAPVTKKSQPNTQSGILGL